MEPLESPHIDRSLTPQSRENELDAVEKSVTEAANRLEQVAELFDKNYNELSEVLGLIADATDSVSTTRTSTVEEMRENWRTWIDRAKEATEKSKDIALLEDRKVYLRELDNEQKDLVQEIIAGRQQTDNLVSKRKAAERTHARVEETISVLQERKETEIPSVDFLLTIVKAITQIRMIPTTDRNLIAGIITHQSKDVEAFQFDGNCDVFSRVNEIWNRIDCE